jgi:hypothetical protein
MCTHAYARCDTAGTGKTVCIKGCLDDLASTGAYMVVPTAFSAQTSANQVRRLAGPAPRGLRWPAGSTCGHAGVVPVHGFQPACGRPHPCAHTRTPPPPTHTHT